MVLRTTGPRGEGQRAEACDERRREVRPHHSSDPHEGRWQSSGEACERTSTTGQGVGGAKGGGRGKRETSTWGRAQDRATTSSGIDRVREVAREKKGERFTTLLHHIDATLLRQAYYGLKRDAAPGVDGMTWDAYGEGLDARLRELESRIHLGPRFVNASCHRRNAVLVPTGHSLAYVPTFQNLMAENDR